ncbi:MAG: sensor domain-containing diguanylate cyclase [Stenomitos rutilans HA7619-LM2]|jgi:diguanylate cyclase (GGDEF)-like protein|nr:sensor domain-containing diguanylate cyclase [Stenomitos rutilans HA7619-LM2]
MQVPNAPENEAARLQTLRALHLLDTPPEERFDRLTRLAKRLFGVPIALVSLVDMNRQWFKSCQGLAVSETPRDVSFCGHAILGDTPFIVPDTLLDDRFHDNPLVLSEPCIRFYAGVPLRVHGSKLGTLCLIDRDPRMMSQEDQALLLDLGHLAEQELAAVQLATIDDLTMLSNRRGFLALGCHTLQLCQRWQQPATLLLFDLNDFKAINDSYGHSEGDRALVTFSQLLKDTFRESDVIGRLGGDEFVVLLSQTDAIASAQSLRRFDQALAEKNRAARGYTLAYSVGLATADPQQPQLLDDLLQAADVRMYAHKRAQQLAASRL